MAMALAVFLQGDRRLVAQLAMFGFGIGRVHILHPQIDVTKAAAPTTVLDSGEVVYTVVVSNPSTDTPLHDVSLVDWVDAGSGVTTSVVAGPFALAAGESRTVTFAANVAVPFAGTVTGETAFDFANPKGCASGFTAIGTGTGTASHIGRTTWESQHCLGPNNTFGNSELVLTAANGDEIHLTYTGSCPGEIPAVGDSFTCSGHAVVTGGTGRFLEATGHLQWDATTVFEGLEDFSWPWTGRLIGTIRY